jgi:hypothetical protein
VNLPYKHEQSARPAPAGTEVVSLPARRTRLENHGVRRAGAEDQRVFITGYADIFIAES